MEIFVEPSKKKIYPGGESKLRETQNETTAQNLPRTSTTQPMESPTYELSEKLLPTTTTKEMDKIKSTCYEGSLEEFSVDDQQCADATLLSTSGEGVQLVEMASLSEEERYGDLLESLIASVSPDELLFKLSIGNEIPENFAPLDQEEQMISQAQDAVGLPDKLATITADETFVGSKEFPSLEDSGEENTPCSKSNKVEELILNFENSEDCSGSNEMITTEQKLSSLEAAAKKIENDEKLRPKESEMFSPDKVMSERRQLSVVLEDLLEEMDSLVDEHKPLGKRNRHRKQILNRRIQALAHANNSAIDQIAKHLQNPQVSTSYCSRTSPNIEESEIPTSKRKFGTPESERSGGFCVKRLRTEDAVLPRSEDCTDKIKEDSEGGLSQRLQLAAEEPQSETFDGSGCEKAMSSEKHAEPNKRVAVVMLPQRSGGQGNKLQEQKNPATTTSENFVMNNGQSFMLQFETQEFPKLGEKYELSKTEEHKLENMEDARIEWRKTHRGTVNWARKLDVEAVLEQNEMHGVDDSAEEDESLKALEETENCESRQAKEREKIQKKLRMIKAKCLNRPVKERTCKRWLIDQDILKGLLKQAIPTTGDEVTLGHQPKDDVTEDWDDEDSSDTQSSRSPVSMDALGAELLQKLTNPEDAEDLFLNSTEESIGDFKDSEESGSSKLSSPASLDALGEELLQKLNIPESCASPHLSDSDRADDDFLESDEEDYNERPPQETMNREPTNQDMPILDLL